MLPDLLKFNLACLQKLCEMRTRHIKHIGRLLRRKHRANRNQSNHVPRSHMTEKIDNQVPDGWCDMHRIPILT